MSRSKNATLNERAFAKEYVLGEKPGNGREAMRKTWKPKPSKTMIQVHPTRLLARPQVKAEIERLLVKYNLTEDEMFKKASEGLNANMVVVNKGEVNETIIPDHNIRHKYWQDMAKIHRLFPNERFENVNVNLDMQMENLSKDELAKLLKSLTKDVR